MSDHPANVNASLPEGLAIRAARAADLEPLHALRRDFNREDGTPFHDEPARAALAAALGDERFVRIWVLADGDTLVGFAILTFGYSLEFLGRDAFVDELYLAPGYRGRQLGGRLLEVMEATCRAEQVRALHLEVDASNERARRLYRRWGFADHSRLLMSKWLR